MLAETHSTKKLVENGLEAFRAEDYQKAIISFLQAVEEYKSNNELLPAAEAANNLSLCYLKSGNPKKAFEFVDGTDKVFEKANDTNRQAIALANQAAVLEGLKKYDQAVLKYEESSRLFKEDGNREKRVMVLESLSQLHLKMGNQLDAMATMQIALDNKKKPSVIERFLKKLLQIPFRS